jgi:hypothetical protein
MVESSGKKGGEQDGLSVGRESRRSQGRTRSPKCWYSFEIAIADAEGFSVHRRQHRSIRFGEDVKVHQSPQTVACGKRCVGELGKPKGSRKNPGGRKVGYPTDLYTLMGCLIRHITRWRGKPVIWGRT